MNAPQPRDVAGYREEQRDLRLRRTKVGCLLTLTLVPLGSALDYFGYPQQFWSILAARVACDVALLPIFFLLFTAVGRRHVVLLSTLWAYAPAVTIAWMIYVTEGSMSPFYAGLNLVIIGTCILLPFGFWEATLYCLGVFGCYAVACAAHERLPFSPPLFINNALFIGMTSTICATASYFYSQARVHDYNLRHDLNERNEQLLALDTMKSRFFANVSHELRTPVTLLLAPIEELLTHASHLPAPAVGDLRMARQNGLRLLRLINELLSLVRFDQKQVVIERHEVRLDQMLSGLVESSQPLARQKEISLDIALPEERLVVEGDATQLEKVFLNLLSNALKFTPSAGTITVAAQCHDGQIEVRVADSGIGIPQDQLPRVFERFRQVDSSETRQYQGLGLGLALARDIVAAHGGQIVAESELGKGSTFTVSLPRVNAPAAEVTAVPSADALVTVYREADLAAIAPQTELAPREQQGQGKVLVADDEPDMRRFLVNSLSQQFAVDEVENGEQALTHLLDEQPDVVVLDMMMPGKSGLDVCREFRRQRPNADTKVLMLTARVDEELKLGALAVGVDDFLTKPFSTAELKARLRILQTAAQMQRELRERNVELGQALTDLRSTEAQLVQTEKMNALGSLAAGLLHELNNPLNHALMAVEVVRASVQRLRAAKSTDTVAAKADDALETLDDVNAALERVTSIISDLRSFAYPETFDVRKDFSLHEVVVTAHRFATSELENVEFANDVSPEIRVTGAPTHITQVLVNMFLNAAAALREVEGARAPRLQVAAEEHDDRIVVSVRDNGGGMPADVRDRIFEPFYTTREVGKGTGLGLSICHTILRNHGSDIAVESTPGEGTTFRFSLPSANCEAAVHGREHRL